MHDLTNLKDMLVKELEEFGKSGNISKTSLDTIDKLAHATKNLAKVIECCEEEESYSNARGRYSREGAYDVTRSYGMDNSYGYSRSNDNLRGQLYKLMETATDERTRDELRKFIDRI